MTSLQSGWTKLSTIATMFAFAAAFSYWAAIGGPWWVVPAAAASAAWAVDGLFFRGVLAGAAAEHEKIIAEMRAEIETKKKTLLKERQAKRAKAVAAGWPLAKSKQKSRHATSARPRRSRTPRPRRQGIDVWRVRGRAVVKTSPMSRSAAHLLSPT